MSEITKSPESEAKRIMDEALALAGGRLHRLQMTLLGYGRTHPEAQLELHEEKDGTRLVVIDNATAETVCSLDCLEC